MTRMHQPQGSPPEKESRYDPLDGYEDWVRPLRAHWPSLFPPRSKPGESHRVKGPERNHNCHRGGTN
jgi:hypothetical protein